MKDICKRIVQLRRKLRPLGLETKDLLVDQAVMDLVDPEEADPAATDETDLVATEEMDRTAEVETNRTQ